MQMLILAKVRLKVLRVFDETFVTLRNNLLKQNTQQQMLGYLFCNHASSNRRVGRPRHRRTFCCRCVMRIYVGFCQTKKY